MSASLLYQMFKTKSSFPLHLAIKHHREDVVFLFLIEFNLQVVQCGTLFDRHDLELSECYFKSWVDSVIYLSTTDHSIISSLLPIATKEVG